MSYRDARQYVDFQVKTASFSQFLLWHEYISYEWFFSFGLEVDIVERSLDFLSQF